MITGDNPLTACHVAKELRFTRKIVLVLTPDIQRNSDKELQYVWLSIDEDHIEQLNEKRWKDLVKSYDLAITGEGLSYLNDYKPQYLKLIIPHITIYARVAPKQKEFVITTLKSLGKI